MEMPSLKKIKIEERSNEVAVDLPSLPYSYPNIYLNDRQVPEIAGWKVGEEYEMVIRVKQSSKNESKDHVDGSFDVVAYHVPKKKKMEDMSDEEFGEYQGKVMKSGKM